MAEREQNAPLHSGTDSLVLAYLTPVQVRSNSDGSPTDGAVFTPDSRGRVTLYNTVENRKLAGNAAPLATNVDKYLRDHPEYVIYNGQNTKGYRPTTRAERLSYVNFNGPTVPIWNMQTRKMVAGTAAPARKNLKIFLETHPHCEVYAFQDKFQFTPDAYQDPGSSSVPLSNAEGPESNGTSQNTEQIRDISAHDSAWLSYNGIGQADNYADGGADENADAQAKVYTESDGELRMEACIAANGDGGEEVALESKNGISASAESTMAEENGELVSKNGDPIRCDLPVNDKSQDWHESVFSRILLQLEKEQATENVGVSSLAYLSDAEALEKGPASQLFRGTFRDCNEDTENMLVELGSYEAHHQVGDQGHLQGHSGHFGVSGTPQSTDFGMNENVDHEFRSVYAQNAVSEDGLEAREEPILLEIHKKNHL